MPSFSHQCIELVSLLKCCAPCEFHLLPSLLGCLIDDCVEGVANFAQATGTLAPSKIHKVKQTFGGDFAGFFRVIAESTVVERIGIL